MLNIYQQQNQDNFETLKVLVHSKPKGFTQMLEARGSKKNASASPKYAYLLQWINEILPFEARSLPTKEKCWWILNGLECAPVCQTCKKPLSSKHFINTVRGYRTYCCTSCTFKSTEYRKHISESQAIALKTDPDFYKKKCMKSKQTRLENNNGKYFSEQSIEKRKETINKDPDFWKKRDKKIKQTRIKNGHSSTWCNSEKAIQTRLANHNGNWEDVHTLARRKQTSQQKYGTNDPSQSDIVKLHKAQAFERKYGKGVKCWSQTPESREYMKAVDEQRKAKELATKRKNGTFNSSKQKDVAYHLLHFMYPHLIRQYKSEEYPFSCNFYDPVSKTYIECNFSWMHGGHWFDSADEDDVKRIECM